MRMLARALTFALVISACSASVPSAESEVDPDGVFAQEEVDTPPANIDPQKASFISEVAVINKVFESLLAFDPVTLRPAAAAAELPSVSPDGLTYRFTLRPDLTYSDGVQLKAGDFAYGISRLCDPAIGASYASFVFPIIGCAEWKAIGANSPPEKLLGARRTLFANGIVVLGDRELEFRLRERTPYFTSITAMFIAAPVRQSEVERAGERGWWLDPASYLGNGPFRLVEWITESHMIFERNERYRQPAKLQRWVVRQFAEGSALEAYQANTIDQIRVNVRNQAVVRSAGLEREMITSPGACTFYVRLNHARPPLDDPKVRAALAKSIDRNAYGNEVRAFSRPASSFIAAGLPGHDPSDRAQETDIDAARSLLAQSRYAGSDQLQGLKWQLSDKAPQLARTEATWIAAQWRSVLGIDVQIEYVESVTLTTLQKNSATRLLFLARGWCADYPDQQDWFSIWFPSSVQKGSGDYGYRNPTVDALLTEADHSADQTKRDELYRRVSRIVSEDVAFIWLAYSQSAALRKPWVGGLNANALDDGGLLHPADVFVKRHAALAR